VSQHASKSPARAAHRRGRYRRLAGSPASSPRASSSASTDPTTVGEPWPRGTVYPHSLQPCCASSSLLRRSSNESLALRMAASSAATLPRPNPSQLWECSRSFLATRLELNPSHPHRRGTALSHRSVSTDLVVPDRLAQAPLGRQHGFNCVGVGCQLPLHTPSRQRERPLPGSPSSQRVELSGRADVRHHLPVLLRHTYCEQER